MYNTDENLVLLDRIMPEWATRLRDDLCIDVRDSNSLASRIHHEVAVAKRAVQAALIEMSPVPIRERCDMVMLGFRMNDLLMGLLKDSHGPDVPAIVRAHTIVMCYLSFAYVSDALFDVLVKALPEETSASKCAAFLRSDRQREFRNAFAHGNWEIDSAEAGINYWALARLPSGDRKLVPNFVGKQELIFWYALSGCVGVAALLAAWP